MAIENIGLPGLETLNQVLLEALEFEKCSICLGKAQDTVLLWPCTHWFCSSCISTLHQSAQGQKVTCPLCKSATTRRSILSFHEEHNEYEDSLQRLIGAISLDLGFDITTYKNNSKTEGQNDGKIVEKSMLNKSCSPVRKTKPSFNKNKRITRSTNLRKAGTQIFSDFKRKLVSPPETPTGFDDSREKKVTDWLESSKFSQVETSDHFETVVVDIHNAELESPTVSEDQLQSVTQVDQKSCEAPFRHKLRNKLFAPPCNIEAIVPFNMFENELGGKQSKTNVKKEPVTTLTDEAFDKILPQAKRTQLITTTYGSNNPFVTKQKKRVLTVESDLFTNFESPLEVDQTLQTDLTQETLQDFSSGSGEEWTIPKKKPTNLFKKNSNFTVRPSKKVTQSKKQNKVSKNTVSYKATRSSVRLSREQNCMNMSDKTSRKSDLSVKETQSYAPVQTNSSHLEPILKKSASEIVKEITDDWNESKVTSIYNISPLQLKHQLVVHDHSDTRKNPPTEFSPLKQINQRSPGWSRLKSTKKEFHMSEKKKLNLKTLGKSKSNPSLTNIKTPPPKKQNKSFNESITAIVSEYQISSKIASKKSENKSLCLSNNNVEYNGEKINFVPLNEQNICMDESVNVCNVGTNLSKTGDTDINKSFASADSNSPCRGFCTPQDEKSGLQAFSKKVVQEEQQTKKCSGTNISSLELTGNDSCTLKDNKNIVSSDFLTLNKPLEVQLKKSNVIEPLTCFPSRNKFIDIQEEVCENSKINKKRDRDSGIHNESSFFSPERKRVCRDAEVQTSPGHKHSFVKEMIRDIWGVMAEQIFENNIIKNLGLQKSNLHKDDQTLMKNMTDVVRNNNGKGDSSFVLTNTLSQSSDKENTNELPRNKNKVEKCLNESDFVMGTEDNTGFCLKTVHIPCDSANSHLNLRTKETLQFQDVDPTAVTQPYKTPIGSRRALTASMDNTYSAVSNPTDSELKRIGDDFDENDVLFSKDISVKSTPWNHSGINKLEDYLPNLKEDEFDTPTPSQSSKEKAYKSRKQLDFVEEDSKDMFEIVNMKAMSERGMKESTSELLDDIVMDVGDVAVLPGKSHEQSLGTQLIRKETGDVLDNYSDSFNFSHLSPTAHCQPQESIVMSENENIALNKSQDMNKLGSEQENVNQQKEIGAETKQKNHNEDNFVVTGNDEVSNASSEDCIVEGTPDVSQIDMQHQNNPCLEVEIENMKLKKDCGSSLRKGLEESSDRESLKEEIKIPKHGQNQSQTRKVEVELSETVVDSESMIEPEGTKRFCFASSLLNQQQTQMLTFVLNGLNMQYSKTVGNHISHLVVSTTNGCSQNTYKFLYAMALHKPIIRFEWVEEVFRTGGTVPLDPYLALDPSGECGVLRAKKDESRALLKDFAIHIYNVNNRIIQKGQIEELVRLCGGTVVTDLHMFHQVSRDMFRVVVLSEPPDSLTQSDWRQKYSAAEVSVDWIYNTVGRYRVVALAPYMLDSDSSAVSFLQHEGYPEDLIFDSSTQ